jgi:hypothetical protein
MKHILIIGLVLGGLALFLNYGQVRAYVRSKLHHTVEQVLPVAKAEPPTPAVLKTNLPVEAGPPPRVTNNVATNAGTNWASSVAQHYADIIQSIRQTRGN